LLGSRPVRILISIAMLQRKNNGSFWNKPQKTKFVKSEQDPIKSLFSFIQQVEDTTGDKYSTNIR